jgi:hypothetical protein
MLSTVIAAAPKALNAVTSQSRSRDHANATDQSGRADFPALPDL